MGLGAIVEVETQSDDALEHRKGRLRVPEPFLLSPVGKTGERVLSVDGDRQILMPGDEPVGFFRLIEEGPLGRSALCCATAIPGRSEQQGSE